MSAQTSSDDGIFVEGIEIDACLHDRALQLNYTAHRRLRFKYDNREMGQPRHDMVSEKLIKILSSKERSVYIHEKCIQ